MSGMRDRLRELYFGDSAGAVRGRVVLLYFDLALVVFFLVTTFVEMTPTIILIDYCLGVILLLEWLSRLWATHDRINFISQPLAIIDLAIILSLFAPALTDNFIFLRVLRSLRLFRSYHLLMQLRKRWRFFREHEQVIFSAANLLIFIFIISSAVYVLQERSNDLINNYSDALYFTVTTLTTTGFGDITLTGQSGRLLAVLIMIVGLSLFLRLLQSVFRPARVQYECPDCGLTRHDRDAVHCKHCGRLLHIRTEGDAGD
ncbi:MAG: ion channel [Wenzhouxiangellaceae bacterium]|nr:ion channel [Wenzhouxiangellaceae bacterium]